MGDIWSDWCVRVLVLATRGKDAGVWDSTSAAFTQVCVCKSVRVVVYTCMCASVAYKHMCAHVCACMNTHMSVLCVCYVCARVCVGGGR